ncbi:hypothetical protein [Afipia sp. Root123D2]|uniref:hypothetical protein n=1 Tax=Afipia sp. Root123D2 TaxID=1736436 RepID=UPI001AEC3997|nr:hypothetical protein [Afipia sp. Root123D2]
MMLMTLTTPEEVDTWMRAPAEESLRLQWPPPDGSHQIVARCKLLLMLSVTSIW